MESTIIKYLSTWKYLTMGVYMDGGTLALIFKNESNDKKQIILCQNINVNYYEELEDNIPGRVYVENQLIEKRSLDEKAVVTFLENLLNNLINKSDQRLLSEKLSFIKSDNYVNFVPVKLELSEKRKNLKKDN
ncbi:MAG: hypothetical protein AB8F74_15290 [Saprospiraceae bacterium]